MVTEYRFMVNHELDGDNSSGGDNDDGDDDDTRSICT